MPRTMNLLLTNPNASRAMTAGIAAAAQAVAVPGTRILARQPSFGPASVEGHFEDAPWAGWAANFSGQGK